MTAVFTLLTY